jgi:hypothetical protein
LFFLKVHFQEYLGALAIMVGDNNRFEENNVCSCMGVPYPFVIVSSILVFVAGVP